MRRNDKLLTVHTIPELEKRLQLARERQDLAKVQQASLPEMTSERLRASLAMLTGESVPKNHDAEELRERLASCLRNEYAIAESDIRYNTLLLRDARIEEALALAPGTIRHMEPDPDAAGSYGLRYVYERMLSDVAQRFDALQQRVSHAAHYREALQVIAQLCAMMESKTPLGNGELVTVTDIKRCAERAMDTAGISSRVAASPVMQGYFTKGNGFDTFMIEHLDRRGLKIVKKEEDSDAVDQ